MYKICQQINNVNINKTQIKVLLVNAWKAKEYIIYIKNKLLANLFDKNLQTIIIVSFKLIFNVHD